MDIVPARVIGVAREKDLALLKIENTRLPELPWRATGMCDKVKLFLRLVAPRG